MNKKISFDKKAWENYIEWQTKDKKLFKRINELIKDIQRNEFDGIGNPEQLKHELSGNWSRRIDNKNRLVYYTDNENIYIVQCKDHY